MLKRLSRAVATTILAGSAVPASATWSILLVDTRTGEVALGSATCLTGFDLRANTPVMIVGLGGVTAQSSVDQRGYNRVFARDRLLEGVPPPEIITLLEGFDSGHQSRQYGIIDTSGGVATFTGANAGQWAGGVVGSFQSFHAGHETTIVYAIQGNVLAGSPVVDEAVDAVINTPGDLAEKLMAGMEAAHMFGGDGRCSCSQQDPDGCGSPPAGWDPDTEKSAHIAYMLIGRAGDLDSCLSVYRVDPASYGVEVLDLDEDGRPDVLTAGNGGLYRMMNSAPDSRFVKLDEAELITTLPARADDLRVGDVTGDGIVDVVARTTANRTVTIVPGLGGGSFGTPVELAALIASPAGLDLADLNADGVLDIITSSGSASQVAIYLGDGLGGFESVRLVPVTGAVTSVRAVDADLDGDLDIAAVLSGNDSVQFVTNDGAGSFSTGTILGTLDDPQDVVAGDLDGDGQFDDFAVAHRSGRALSVFLHTNTIERTDIVVTQRMVFADIDDLDGDGDLDIAAMRLGGSRFASFLNDGTGSFTLDSEDNQLAGGGRSFRMADITGNGLPDAISGGANPGLSALPNLGPDSPIGLFAKDLGCASGDYYMTFNVANQQANDEDPTRQLRALFDAWRADLTGRPDAVTSEVAFADEPLFADGRATTMTVTLMDWNEGSISVPVSLSVAHAPGSAGLTSIDAVTDLGGGVFEITLSGAHAAGTDIFEIVADDGQRPVTLMPAPTLEIVLHPADLQGDGDVDADDFFTYLDFFASGDDRADIQGDGDIDADDFFAFLDLFVL